jgi:type III restriction enzyme
MLADIGKAKIVITNYHAFNHREKMEISKVGRSLLTGRGEPPETLETDGQMLQRACGELLALKDKLVVINDEAHHCYRHKVRDEEDEEDLKGEEKDEAKKNNEAARLWISGIEALKRTVGVRAVYDLSATPFFLRGSGYAEGTLFPWTVSDFSLMDAIESGIVKLPRVPVADNLPGKDEPVYRNLWEHIGKKMPKKGRGKSGLLDPLSLPSPLQTALSALYGHYEKTFDLWERAGIETPPVFIVVCNNTSASQIVYEWIAGWEREEDGERHRVHSGHLKLFSNYDDFGARLARPRTLLIDSEQLESGEALDPQFREMAEAEIELFKREKAARDGAGTAEKIADSDLLREVMNTVGKKGRLGEQIRCVVSVAMLTEGWDTNTVTHICGVRAFGTQLLCEQVVGRALRRQSYSLNESGLFDAEYADIMGIPFDFAAKPVVVVPKPPKPTTRVTAIKERKRQCEIVFPRVEGYRVELPDERITAHFGDDHRLRLTPELVGPCVVRMEPLVGEGIDLNMETFDSVRPSTISYHLAKHLMYTRFREPGEEPPLHLFGQIQRVVRQWLEGGWLQCAGGTKPGQVLYREIAETACQLIYMTCQKEEGGSRRIKAILDAYNPRGSTKHVSFTTSRTLYKTAPNKCHVNYVVCDSDWEAELARVLESHKRVIAYVKNQGLQFEAPYRLGSTARKYLPDFIVKVDDGREDPLHLVLETKGYRRIDAQVKAETMKSLWVPGVNNLGQFGRWAFAEFTDVFEIEAAFGKLMERLRA